MLHINPDAFMSLSAQLFEKITDNGELLKVHRKILGSFLELQDDISHAKQILKDLETSTPGLGRHALITDLINLLYQTLPFKVINRKTLTIFARLDIMDIRKTIIDMHDFLLVDPCAPLGHTHKENSVRKYSAENWKKVVDSEHYQLPLSIRSIDFLEELYAKTGNEEELANLSKLRQEIKYVKLINDAEGEFSPDDFEDVEFQPPTKHAS